MTGTDQQNKPFRDYAAYIRDRYGETVYRIPLDLGFGCPHRHDGEGGGGCIYCGPSGSRAVHLEKRMPLEAQVEAGIAYARERYGATAFMVYGQAFTSTNAPVEVLRECLGRVLAMAPFKAVILGTRPDCLPPETVDYLAELQQEMDVWVELGVQSANEATLERIHRGHDFSCVIDTCQRLVRRGIHVAPHIILGLPGETREDYHTTASQLAQLPFSGIKIHNLHVIRDTPLADMYRQGRIHVMDEHEYGEILMDFLRRIPSHWVIMRMTTDTPQQELIAPQWWMTKGQFIQYIERQMRQRQWRQGDLCSRMQEYRASAVTRTRLMSKRPDERDITAFRDGAFCQCIKALDTNAVIPTGTTTIVASGFGLESITLEALDQMPRHLVDRVRLFGLGTDPGLLAANRRSFPEYAPLLNALEFHGRFHDDRIEAGIYWGDPRKNVFRLRGEVDLILLENGNMDENIILASQDYLIRLLHLLSPKGAFLTTSSHASIRGALHRLGLALGTTENGVIPGGGTIATRNPELLKYPLDEEKCRIIEHTPSGAPFRDPQLTWSRKQILQHREKVLARLRDRERRKHPANGTSLQDEDASS